MFSTSIPQVQEKIQPAPVHRVEKRSMHDQSESESDDDIIYIGEPNVDFHAKRPKVEPQSTAVPEQISKPARSTTPPTSRITPPLKPVPASSALAAPSSLRSTPVLAEDSEQEQELISIAGHETEDEDADDAQKCAQYWDHSMTHPFAVSPR